VNPILEPRSLGGRRDSLRRFARPGCPHL